MKEKIDKVQIIKGNSEYIVLTTDETGAKSSVFAQRHYGDVVYVEPIYDDGKKRDIFKKEESNCKELTENTDYQVLSRVGTNGIEIQLLISPYQNSTPIFLSKDHPIELKKF